MAYTAPTPADFQARFPKFAGVDNAIIQAALTEAGRMVDNSWTESDYAPAIMFLAAHYLTLEGHGGGAQAEIGAAGTGSFKMMRTGSLTLERFDRVAASSQFDDTSYGQRFKSLLDRNAGGPVVISE